MRNILCDPNHTPTKQEIANYVMRFFVAYIYPGSVNRKLTHDEVEDIFNQCLEILSLPKSERRKLIWKVDDELLNACIYSEYALTMLYDIAQTCWLVEEIIHKKLTKIGDEPYFWLDLGTWSGILLDAQDICRLRNGFKNGTNIGIDRCMDHVQRATKLLLQLWNSKIVLWDLNDPKTYANLPKTPLHQVSAELIGQPWVDVSMPEDPFHSTMSQLFSQLWPQIDSSTVFFPQEFHMNITHFGKHVFTIIGTPNNVFHADLVLKIEQAKENPRAATPYMFWPRTTLTIKDTTIECDKVKIGGDVIPLENIGQEYSTSWLVTQDLYCKPRRWINQRKVLIEMLQNTDTVLQVWLIDVLLESVIKNNIVTIEYFSNPQLVEKIESLKATPDDEDRRIALSREIVANLAFKKDIINFLRLIPLKLLK